MGPGPETRAQVYMAQWIKANGEVMEVQPRNGKDFQLDELKQYIGGGYIEVINIPEGRQMVMDEEGKLKMLPKNEKATDIARPVLLPTDWGICGDVLVCKKGEID